MIIRVAKKLGNIKLTIRLKNLGFEKIQKKKVFKRKSLKTNLTF